MPAPLDPDKRAAILAAVQAIADGAAPERSAGSIAREHGVAVSTVTRIARTAGLDAAWQRTQTARASRAKQVDNRSRRAALSSGMLADAERLRDERLWAPATVVTATGGKVTLDLPTAADVRQFGAAITGFVKSSLEIDEKDAAEESHAAVDSWLRDMTGE